MYCEKCGKQINDDAKFCPYCGATLKKEKKTLDTGVQKADHRSLKNRKPLLVIVIAGIIAGLFLIHGALGNKDHSTVEKDDEWADKVVQTEWYTFENADQGTGLRFLKQDDQVTVSVWLDNKRVTDFMPCVENDSLKQLTIPEKYRQSSVTSMTYVEKDDSFYLVVHFDGSDSMKCYPSNAVDFAR